MVFFHFLLWQVFNTPSLFNYKLYLFFPFPFSKWLELYQLANKYSHSISQFPRKIMEKTREKIQKRNMELLLPQPFFSSHFPFLFFSMCKKAIKKSIIYSTEHPHSMHPIHKVWASAKAWNCWRATVWKMYFKLVSFADLFFFIFRKKSASNRREDENTSAGGWFISAH